MTNLATMGPRDSLRVHPANGPAVELAGQALVDGVPNAFATLCRAGMLELPSPGSGQSWERWRALAEFSALDLSLGRLCEGHTDASAILAEAGAREYAGLYGVWAAGDGVTASQDGDGGWALTGQREYCSGAGLLQRALVTARAGDDALLFDVDLDQSGIETIYGSWPAVGMAGSASATVTFDRATATEVVGAPGHYSQRAGFWQGSLNVAACWYGGALGITRGLFAQLGENADGHRMAEAGAAATELATMRAILHEAATATDAEPDDCFGNAMERALTVRAAVYGSCTRLLEHAARAGGTAMLTHDAGQARRFADLPVYLRQHSPGRDLELVARKLAGAAR